MSLEALFERRPEEIAAMNERMKALTELEGLPYGQRTHTFNSRLAQELGCWADTQAGGDELHTLLYRAYFVHSQNIGEIDVLVELAASAGLSPDLAREVLEGRSFQDAVDADWEKSRRYGITGVPTFVALGQKLVGAQPYDALAEFLTHLGAKPSTGDKTADSKTDYQRGSPRV
jgi:predicted DsbA family dithiol-disulfide isomerase